MTQSPTPPDAGAAPADPSEQFRVAYNAVTSQIEEIALLEEVEVEREEPTGLRRMFHRAHAVQTASDGTAISAREAGNFAALAQVLGSFQTTLQSIVFPPEASSAARALEGATRDLFTIATRHANTADPAEPSIDKKAAHEFFEAAEAFEGAARNAGKALGLE